MSSHQITSCEYPTTVTRTCLVYGLRAEFGSRVLFITSVLGAVWAIATLFRRKSTRNSSYFVAFVDLCFVGAFIASVYELRGISSANCSSFAANNDFNVSLGSNGFSGNSPFTASINKTCEMLKASFAFGIMNTIFFFITSFLLLFMHRTEEKEVVVKETYRRRSHDSRYSLYFQSVPFLWIETNTYMIDVAILAVVAGTTGAQGTADANITSKQTNYLESFLMSLIFRIIPRRDKCFFTFNGLWGLRFPSIPCLYSRASMSIVLYLREASERKRCGVPSEKWL